MGTSAAVLKTEFKKMMKEMKVEHSRALRVSFCLFGFQGIIGGVRC